MSVAHDDRADRRIRAGVPCPEFSLVQCFAHKKLVVSAVHESSAPYRFIPAENISRVFYSK